MPRRQPIRVAAILLLAISLSACLRPKKADNKGMGVAVGFAAAAMYKPPSTGQTPGKVVLPNPKAVGCSTSTCPPVLPQSTDARAVYPWQVSLDYTDGAVIGLTALYDDPTSVEDVRAAVNERYEKFALDFNGKTPVDLWRVEPEKLAISITTNEYGMVRLIYLTFGAKHPTSEKALEKILARMAKGGSQ